MPGSNGRDIAYGNQPYLDLKHRFYVSLGLIVLVVGVSTVGFWLVQSAERNWFRALWETLNVISTVGSLDRMNQAERIWAMVVIIFGLGAVLYGFGNLTALLTSGEIFHVFERRKMERRISALSGHVILCGFGNTGHLVAEQLTEYDVPFVVIDKDKRQVEDASAREYLVIEDDCTREEVLETAGVTRARGLVTTLESDAENVFVVLTAKGMAPK